MSRPAFPWVLLAAASLAGCNPPGKPQPVKNGGIPEPVMDFSGLFAEHCQGCHGKDGDFGPGPPLDDPLFLRIVPTDTLVQTISYGRPNTPMPAHLKEKGGKLSAAQVKVLAEGLKSFWGRPGGPADAPPYPFVPGGDASRGTAIFARACAGCHGADGQGRDAGAIHETAFLELCSDQLFRRIIITGRPDLGMPNFAENTARPPDFKPLDAQDVTDLSALLISWRKAGENKK